MSFESPLFRPPGFVAGADLSAVQHRFVKQNGTGLQVIQATVAGEQIIGVLQNNPDTIGVGATVMTAGISKVEAGATIAIGDLIKTDTVGRAAVASAAVTDTTDAASATDPLIGSFVQGVALEAGAVGELIAVLLEKQGAVPTTVA